MKTVFKTDEVCFYWDNEIEKQILETIYMQSSECATCLIFINHINVHRIDIPRFLKYVEKIKALTFFDTFKIHIWAQSKQ
jgi:hypothetical protein